LSPVCLRFRPGPRGTKVAEAGKIQPGHTGRNHARAGSGRRKRGGAVSGRSVR
jgi:hypothetical protein